MDGRAHCLSIPTDKREKAIKLLNWAENSKKATIHFIQQLTGVLNFLCKAIVPGRTFMRRMYNKLKITDKTGNPLKQFHHVNLDREFKKDCAVWKQFITGCDNSILCRPFIDFEATSTATILEFYSDASMTALGATYGNRWIVGIWGKQFTQIERPSIEFLELFALVAAILAWGWKDELKNSWVVVYCDNKSVRDMINGTGMVSHCHQCMKLLRILALDNIAHNRKVMVQYVKSEDNTLADAISRLNFVKFWKYAAKEMFPKPDKIPSQIWPVAKVWNDSEL